MSLLLDEPKSETFSPGIPMTIEVPRLFAYRWPSARSGSVQLLSLVKVRNDDTVLLKMSRSALERVLEAIRAIAGKKY